MIRRNKKAEPATMTSIQNDKKDSLVAFVKMILTTAIVLSLVNLSVYYFGLRDATGIHLAYDPFGMIPLLLVPVTVIVLIFVDVMCLGSVTLDLAYIFFLKNQTAATWLAKYISKEAKQVVKAYNVED